MLVDETTEEQEYKEGYKCGYEWLSSGRWNFLHPYGIYTYPDGHKIHGYVPGGPHYITRAVYGSKEYPAQNNMVSKLHKAWHNGWIDGINKYVKENNLPYAQVPNER